MKTLPVPSLRLQLPALAAALMLTAVPPAMAQAGAPATSADAAAGKTSDLQSLLRDALFEEEATRDLTKAAAGYETLLTKWGEQRQLAASALFRLAEVRRKQDRKDDAIKLYQRLLTEFADVEPQAKLSRENLAGLGEKTSAPAATADADPATPGPPHGRWTTSSPPSAPGWNPSRSLPDIF